MRKHLELLLISLLLTLAFCALAQEKDSVVQEKMEYFKFAEGEWGGPVEIPNRDGTTQLIQQHENVEMKLSGTLLLIEGTGTNDEGEVLFNAIATIFYDKVSDAYRMFAFRDNGQFTEAAIEIVGDQNFTWSFSPNPTTFIKYEMNIADGRWVEKGFYSSDNEKWSEFFAMDLKKIEGE